MPKELLLKNYDNLKKTILLFEIAIKDVIQILEKENFSELLCLRILKLFIFLIFPTHPKFKPTALKYPNFCYGGLRPLIIPP